MENREYHPSACTVLASQDNPLFLTSLGGEKNSRLGIVDQETLGRGYKKEIQSLVQTLLLAHLVSSRLPERIETNFPVEFTGFLEGLYKHYGRRSPVISRFGEDSVDLTVNKEADNATEGKDYASAVSGGADSAFRVADLVARGESVVGIHIQNLNKAPLAEAVASEKQCKSWGVTYEKVKLLNSSGNGGFETMRTRDLLIGGICAMVADRYGASEVQIEGGMIDNPEKCEYSEYTQAWDDFNKMLAVAGLGLKVTGVDPGDLETVREIIRIEKETDLSIIPLIQNCFSAPYQLPNIRRKWEKKTPHLAEASSSHWCGSCIKCRRMSLGRIYYEDPALGAVPESEKVFFVQDTYRWIHEYPKNRVLLTDNFKEHLGLLGQALGGVT